jgi:hypothetical protein
LTTWELRPWLQPLRGRRDLAVLTVTFGFFGKKTEARAV